MNEIDYIDVSQKKTVVFQETELKEIADNMRGLTKEGIEEEIALWKGSNHVVTAKFQTMLKQCKNIQPSGKTKEGKIILARDKDGNATWVKEDSKLKK